MADSKINNEGVPDGFGPRAEWVPPGCAPPTAGSVSAWIAGTPAPQGSKRALGAGRPGGKIRLVETAKGIKAWRAELVKGFRTMDTVDGPVVVKIVFVCPRPKATPKTRATPPKVTKPDLDKLERAVLDALTIATVIADDSFVVTLHGHKRLAELGEPTGAMVHVEPAPHPLGPRGVGCFPPAQDTPETGSDRFGWEPNHRLL